MTEITAPHTRILKCALLIDASRSYWEHADPTGPPAEPGVAFERFWFGAVAADGEHRAAARGSATS